MFGKTSEEPYTYVVVQTKYKEYTYLSLKHAVLPKGNHLASTDPFLTALCFERKTSRGKTKMPRALQLCHFKI